MPMNMIPNKEYITIGDNERLIETFLKEVILSPRMTMLHWSEITNQTPNLKIGYPGQHLASLILGMQGTGTGARGDDIADGTEVKSCSRVDQVDKCNNCKSNVLRIQSKCPLCGSSNIKRNNDSKWLIGIRNEKELDLYLNKIPRMLFIISDYPYFEKNDFSIIRFSAYEIWNQSPRAKKFRTLLIDYYQNIYLAHIEKNPNQTPAPKNFWPYSYQFYLCNPIKVFECTISNANTTVPKLHIDYYVEPNEDRNKLESEVMPFSILNKDEIKILASNGFDFDSLKLNGVSEKEREILPLRDISIPVTQETIYQRRS